MGTNARKLFETPFFSLEVVDWHHDGGLPYYRLTGPDSAIALLFNEELEILVVRQFRPNLDEMTIEFPAGAIESGEQPIVAARREILEETGYRSEIFQLGDYFHLMMNRTNIRDYLFCGLVEEQEPYPAEEGIGPEWVSREQFRVAVFDGEYRQLGGLGIIQLASQRLGVDVLTAPKGALLRSLRVNLGSDNQAAL